MASLVSYECLSVELIIIMSTSLRLYHRTSGVACIQIRAQDCSCMTVLRSMDPPELTVMSTATQHTIISPLTVALEYFTFTTDTEEDTAAVRQMFHSPLDGLPVQFNGRVPCEIDHVSHVLLLDFTSLNGGSMSLYRADPESNNFSPVQVGPRRVATVKGGLVTTRPSVRARLLEHHAQSFKSNSPADVLRALIALVWTMCAPVSGMDQGLGVPVLQVDSVSVGGTAIIALSLASRGRWNAEYVHVLMDRINCTGPDECSSLLFKQAALNFGSSVMLVLHDADQTLRVGVISTTGVRHVLYNPQTRKHTGHSTAVDLFAVIHASRLTTEQFTELLSSIPSDRVALFGVFTDPSDPPPSPDVIATTLSQAYAQPLPVQVLVNREAIPTGIDGHKLVLSHWAEQPTHGMLIGAFKDKTKASVCRPLFDLSGSAQPVLSGTLPSWMAAQGYLYAFSNEREQEVRVLGEDLETLRKNLFLQVQALQTVK